MLYSLFIPAMLGFLSLSINSDENKIQSPPKIAAGIIEVTEGNTIKEGIIMPISYTTGLTSAHILRDSSQGTIQIGKEKRTIAWVKEWRSPSKAKNPKNPINQLSDLDSDIFLVGWEEPISIQAGYYFSTPSWRHPQQDEEIWMPKVINGQIHWEKRFIVGIEGYAAWTNLPKDIYRIILYLNGNRINDGSPIKIGDSGGGWISMDGELLAITSRIKDHGFGPTHQIVYATLTNNEAAPKSAKTKQILATLPAVATITVLSFALIIWKIKSLHKRKKEINIK